MKVCNLIIIFILLHKGASTNLTGAFVSSCNIFNERYTFISMN